MRFSGGGPKTLRSRTLPAPDVPALQHQARVIHAVIVVQMGEQRVRHVGRPEPALDQPLMRAGTVIQNDRLVADLERDSRSSAACVDGAGVPVPSSVSFIARFAVRARRNSMA